MRHERHQLRPACALILGLALVLLWSAAAQAQAWGEARQVESPVNVRQLRSPQSPVVRTLKPGERVKVDFLRPSGWGAVFELDAAERDESKAMGFADVRLLKPVGPGAAPAAAPAAAPGAGPLPARPRATAAATAPIPAPAAAAPARAMAAAPASAAPHQVSRAEARTEVYKERSLKSPVVAVLVAGERVQTAFQRDGFLAVFRMDEAPVSEAAAVGFVPVGMVKSLPDAASPPAAQPAAQSVAQPVAQPAPARTAEAKPAAPVKAAGHPATASEMKAEVKSPALLGAQPQLNKQAPVRITSDKMVYNQAENSVVFLGNVHGTHTDMAIWAERITAYFTDKKKPKEPKQEKGPEGDLGDKIERIVADGNVRLVANKNEGACALLTYTVNEGVIRMDGNPILREGQNTIRGDVIKFYIRENRSEVLSGTQHRVEAIFQSPKGDKK